MDTELKECPICGKVPERFGSVVGYFVECSCGMFPFPPAGTRADADERWNNYINKKAVEKEIKRLHGIG